jgi:predicted RNase H-like nuclease (RuvC/YqgF family)
MMVTDKNSETADSGDEEEAQKQENEELEREVKGRDATILRLEQERAERDSEIASLKQAMEEAESRIDELGEALAKAVAAYREQVIQGNPGVPADMVTGETVEEIDESVKKGLALVEKVRQEMEAEAAKTRIPGGAPPRTPIDLSGLSAREKIRYAIGGS